MASLHVDLSAGGVVSGEITEVSCGLLLPYSDIHFRYFQISEYLTVVMLEWSIRIHSIHQFFILFSSNCWFWFATAGLSRKRRSSTWLCTSVPAPPWIGVRPCVVICWSRRISKKKSDRHDGHDIFFQNALVLMSFSWRPRKRRKVSLRLRPIFLLTCVHLHKMHAFYNVKFPLKTGYQKYLFIFMIFVYTQEI